MRPSRIRITTGASGADHNLLADDVESTSEVSTPAITQKHVLTVVHVESTSEVSAPAVSQVHALLADDTESASEVSAPVVTQLHVLLAGDVESASEVSAPALSENTADHNLLGDDVESTSEVSTPTLAQVHVLFPDNTESASEVSSPVINQVHALLADNAESASEVSSPALIEGANDKVIDGQATFVLNTDYQSVTLYNHNGYFTIDQVGLAGDIVEVAIKTSNYTVTGSDENIVCDTSGSAFTVELLASPETGRTYTVILETAGNILTIDGNGNNINGSPSITLVSAYDAVELLYNGVNWSIK